MVLEDGASHAVDSNEHAFKFAAIGAVRASEHLILSCLSIKMSVVQFLHFSVSSVAFLDISNCDSFME